MTMVRWLDRKLTFGLYRGPVKSCVVWADQWLSLNNFFKTCIRKRLAISGGSKTPAWVSEIYQLLSLGAAVVFVVLASFAPSWVACIAAIFALYRPFEILVLAVAWVFVHVDPLHSYKRSLAGFIINIAEVVIFYAASYLGFGLVKPTRDISTALYSSLRITVTIGPIAATEPPESWLGGTLIITQIVVSYFFTIVVIASVIGALPKRDKLEK